MQKFFFDKSQKQILFVKNLPKEMNNEDVLHIFSEFSPKSAKIDNSFPNEKGARAIIEFHNIMDRMIAYEEMDDAMINDFKIKISKYPPKKNNNNNNPQNTQNTQNTQNQYSDNKNTNPSPSPVSLPYSSDTSSSFTFIPTSFSNNKNNLNVLNTSSGSKPPVQVIRPEQKNNNNKSKKKKF